MYIIILLVVFLLAAVSRNVTSSQLTPLVTNGDTDRKISTSGRAKCRWLDPKLPLIALSALDGNEYMLQKLHTKGADITFVDSKTGQNLLHMTCSTGLAGAVRWCLQYPQISVDCMASPRRGDLKMTPLMHVLKHLNSSSEYDICKALIDAGCDVSKTDSAGWTTLYYVTMNDNPELTTLTIKSAPSHPTVTLSRRRNSDGHSRGMLNFECSPMVRLLEEHNDIVNSCLLLEAGYNVKKDDRLIEYLTDTDNELHKCLEQEMCEPSGLLSMCRIVIRNVIGRIKLQEKIQSLNLPVVLITYLQLNVEVSNNPFLVGR